MKKRILSTFLTLVLLLTLLPTAVMAEGNTIYTDMSYKGAETGSYSQPYASFERALEKARDGDTIAIKGKGFINVQTVEDAPFVINKAVTITGDGNLPGELYIRASGILLGADVTMRNVELNLANKYHNAIFVNGHSFNAENVTRGSGSRAVHLFAGGLTTTNTIQIPAPGSAAALTLKNSVFGNIHGGGMNGSYTGSAEIHIEKSTVGAIYSSGAKEATFNRDNWFDTTEPPAPEVNAAYTVNGSVNITVDGASTAGGTYTVSVDGNGSNDTSLTINTAKESKKLNLAHLTGLTVNGGSATVAAINETADVALNNAAIDFSGSETKTVSSLSGGGKIVLGKEDMLTISGAFDGAYTFETSGGVPGASGLAKYDHTYITAGTNNVTVKFTPYSSQAGMSLTQSNNAWVTSAMPDSPSYVDAFSVLEESKTVAIKASELNANDSAGVDVMVHWTSPGLHASLADIPLRFSVLDSKGKVYAAQTIREKYDPSEEGGEGSEAYVATISELGMKLEMADSEEANKGIITVRKNVSENRDVPVGIYIFSVFAPDANGGEIQQSFTLIVTEENSGKTKTSTAITSIDSAAFGDTLTLTATVTANGTPVDNPAVEYYINGKRIDSNSVSVTPGSGFKLGSNELRAIYPGDTAYAVSVGTASVTVSKATGARIDGFHAPSNGTFDGTAHTGSQSGLTVKKGSITLDDSPSVTVKYTLNGQAVSQPVFPGTYIVTLSAPAGETYTEIWQEAGNFTIGKAAPTVTASAEDKGSGTVELTATVSGVGAYFPTGSVTFSWDDQTFIENLSNGTASHTVSNADAGTYQYSASYTPADNDALYDGASSGERSIDVNGSQPQPPVKPEITLTDISITKAPDKTSYIEGDTFDPTGMAVTATYSDSTTKVLGSDAYIITPNGPLTVNTTEITVSYTEKGVTQTAAQAITVTPKDPTVTPGAVVTINGAPATAVYGDSFTLTASAANAGTNGAWTWTSSNPAVLEITGSGSSVTVKALKASTALVTVTANYVSDGTEGSDSASITVTHRAISVKADSKSMTVGGTLPALTVSCGNFASGDTADMVFATQAAASTTADGKTAGSFPITVTAPTLKDGWADKYELGTMESGTLTVRAQSSGGSSNSGGGSSSGGSSSSGKVETTTKPDGTKIQTETKKDGTKVETTTAKDGSTSKTTTNPNGSSVTENKAADGSTGTVKTDQYGQTTAETQLSSKAVETAKKNGEPVKAPVEVEATRNSNTAPVVNIEVPKSAGETKVEIPVSNVKPGTVAVLVHPDGTEEILKNSVSTEDGIQLTVNGGVTVKIVDNSKDFIDTREHWSRDQVNFVAARELFQGVGDNQFGVGRPMTRGMVNTVLARLAGVDTTPATGQNWYDKGIAWARENGVSDGTNPNGNVTREQLATMLYRYAGSPTVSGTLSFTDTHEANLYAQDALLWAVQNGILNGYGDGRVGPKANAERAQVAAMMARFIQNAQ